MTSRVIVIIGWGGVGDASQDRAEKSQREIALDHDRLATHRDILIASMAALAAITRLPSTRSLDGATCRASPPRHGLLL
jgi:hypothetical protein